MTPSDIAILIAASLAVVFALDYGIGSPWYRSLLGWVIFLYAAATVGLLVLIVHAVLFDFRAPEPLRFTIAAGVAVALAAKITILELERHRGRKERRLTHKEKP